MVVGWIAEMTCNCLLKDSLGLADLRDAGLQERWRQQSTATAPSRSRRCLDPTKHHSAGFRTKQLCAALHQETFDRSSMTLSANVGTVCLCRATCPQFFCTTQSPPAFFKLPQN